MLNVVSFSRMSSLLPALAKNIHCHTSDLVSNIADTLLDYSLANHRLHHEVSPIGLDDDVIQHLIAKDALKVMQLIEKSNIKLKRELLTHSFSKKTYNESDPHKHPIVTFLRAHLASGNLHEGSKICRTLENCTGLDEETERCCWYLLFDSLQQTGYLLEHDWPINGKFLTPRVESVVTLANIMIGPFGRSVALEYLNGIVETAKDEFFPGFKALVSSTSIRSKYQADHNKQYLVAIKDAVRRTVLKFLLPRPHSPAEVLSIATRVSEADKPPQLKYHNGPAKDQDVGKFCCMLLQQPSLLKLWEENQASVEEGEEAASLYEATLREETSIAVSRTAQREILQQDMSIEKGGILDMSMELIPSTPLGTPQTSPPASLPATKSFAAENDIIELGDSEDSHVVIGSGEIELKESSDVVKEGQPQQADGSTTKSFGSPSYTDELEREGEAYDVNDEHYEEKRINYPPYYHQYPGNYR